MRSIMKSITIVYMVLFTIGAVSTTRSQCTMGGGSRHTHGDQGQSTHKEHASERSAAKGYAFINDDGKQEATVTIKNGYEPSVLVVKRGIPLKLNFDLQEEDCTGTVVFKDFDIQKTLTPYELDAVEFTPDTAGTFTFACPMRMIEGTLIVKE